MLIGNGAGASDSREEQAAKAGGQGFLGSEFLISAERLFHDELPLRLSPRDPSHSPDQALNNQTNSLSSLLWLRHIPFDLEGSLVKQAKGRKQSGEGGIFFYREASVLL